MCRDQRVGRLIDTGTDELDKDPVQQRGIETCIAAQLAEEAQTDLQLLSSESLSHTPTPQLAQMGLGELSKPPAVTEQMRDQ